MAMNAKDVEAFATEVVAVMRKALTTRDTKIAALEAEVEKLKARPLQKWAGTFAPGTQYSEASLTTHRGGLWVATKTTRTIPGEAGGDWRLIVKKGEYR